MIGNQRESVLCTFRSDAMVVKKNGYTGIGVEDPLYRLAVGTGGAAKPDGSSWTVACDARLKDVRGPYRQGLAAISALYDRCAAARREHSPGCTPRPTLSDRDGPFRDTA